MEVLCRFLLFQRNGMDHHPCYCDALDTYDLDDPQEPWTLSRQRPSSNELNLCHLASAGAGVKMCVAEVAAITAFRGLPTVKAMRAFGTGNGVKRPKIPKEVSQETSYHRFRTTVRGGRWLGQERDLQQFWSIPGIGFALTRAFLRAAERPHRGQNTAYFDNTSEF